MSEHPYRARPPAPMADDASIPLDRCAACGRVVFRRRVDRVSGGHEVVLDLHAPVFSKLGTRWSRDGFAAVEHAAVCLGLPHEKREPPAHCPPADGPLPSRRRQTIAEEAR